MEKKILVVEDEATLHKALVDVLGQAGYKTFSALDGAMGLELSQKEKPDLVLLDIILPKMDGFEVLKNIKGDKDTSSIPVLMLTNLGDMEDVQKALEYGANGYLVKADFHLDDVLRKVEEILAK